MPFSKKASPPTMRTVWLRLPPWCTFAGTVTLVVLVCLISMKLVGNASGDGSSAYEVASTMLTDFLQPWERDTASEYMLKLHTTAAQSEPPHLRFYEFEVSTQVTYIGGTRRVLTVINGQYPGPLVEAIQGDRIIINVINKINSAEYESPPATSLHFHGQLMNGTNFYDGSVGMTQCGIMPGKNYTYAFEADTPGTSWYHSHWRLQQIEGLVGPLVVHERASLSSDSVGKMDSSQTKSQQEAVLLLTDLYNRRSEDLLLDYMEPWIGGKEEPIPDIVLAQGKIDPSINFRKGGKTRIRIVNACSYTAVRVELEGASMMAVEADGTPLESATVNSLMVYPAQRYSIMTTLDECAWLHTTPQLSLYGNSNPSARKVASTSGSLKTLLCFDGSKFKTSRIASGVQLSEEELIEPYFAPQLDMSRPRPVPEHADLESFVDLSMFRLESGEIAGALNNQVYRERTLGNMLQSVLQIPNDRNRRHEAEAHHRHGQSPRLESLLSIHSIQTLDLLIRNFDDGPHPVHLHGHKVWILSRGNVGSDTPFWKSPSPLKRDTVWLPEDQWVRVRTVVDNPGIWAVHCHIPWHSSTGMKGAILALPQQLKKQTPPAEWYDLCQR